MAGKEDESTTKDARKERLAAQLRANLMRRKGQARAKRAEAAEAPETDQGNKDGGAQD